MIHQFRGVLISLIAATLVGCGQDAERSETGDIVQEGTLDVFTIHIGDCFDDQSSLLGDDDSEVESVPAVPCNEAHDNEAFYKFDVTLSEWPGDDALSDMGDEECIKNFQAYVGETYDDSSLAVYSLRPTEYGWRKLKDREVVCVAYDMDGKKLSQPVKNSGI